MAHLDRRTIALAGTLLASTAVALAVHAAGGSERAMSTASARLDARVARDVIHGHAEAVRRSCFRRADAAGTRVKLEIVVAPDGSVANARVSLVEGDAEVAACVRDEASAWSFPRSDRGGRFVVPFEFSDD